MRCSPVQSEVLTSADALERLVPEWRALAARCDGTLFQYPEWLVPWWRVFVEPSEGSPGGAGRVLAWRHEGGLAGMAPFFVHQDSSNDLRKLLLVGCGTSDYLDVLIDPDHRSEVLGSLRHWFWQTSHEWDRCDLVQLPPGSPLLDLAPDHPPAPGDPCPVLSLEGRGAHDYSPARQLEKARYYRRRASKFGRVEWIESTPETVALLMRRLFELHEARWRQRNESGVLSCPEVQRFHLCAARRLQESGLLRLFGLKLNDAVAGVFYGMATARCTYYYLSGFDPGYDKLSPGTLLIARAIERALSEGHVAFNFLRGQESYKYAWGAFDSPTFNVGIDGGWHRRSTENDDLQQRR